MCNILPRIKEIAKREGITITAFERSIGASKGVLSRAINNGTDVQAKWIQAIVENYPQYSAQWLISGVGDMIKKQESNAKIIGPYIEPKLGDPGVYRIPSLPVSAQASFVECLAGDVYINPLEDFRDVLLLPDELPYKDDLTTIQVDGESMEPRITDGAWILSRRIKDSQFGNVGGVVFVSYSDYFVLKRVKANRLFTENYIILSSDNKDYGEMTVQLSDIRAMWKAIRIISSPIL